MRKRCIFSENNQTIITRNHQFYNISMKKLKSLLLGLLVVAALPAQNKLPIYLDNTQPIELRIKDALSKMTTEEKVAMCHAQSKHLH